MYAGNQALILQHGDRLSDYVSADAVMLGELALGGKGGANWVGTLLDRQS
jgi:hypothetical protein